MKIIGVVGHRKGKGGAYNSKFNVNEWDFNNIIGRLWLYKCLNLGLNVSLEYRDTYKRLPEKLNKQNPNAIISFHCNGSFIPSVEGAEVLHWHNSIKGTAIGMIWLNEILEVTKNKDRGLKPISDPNQRGYHLFSKTKAPFVMVEPFFISNDKILHRFLCDKNPLVNAYVEATKKTIEYLEKINEN